MTLSFRKGLFLFLFACFQILFVFFSSTGYEIILVSLFIVFLTFYFWFFKLKLVFDYKVGLFWIGLISSLLISSFFTHSLPLSLESFVFYSSAFYIYTFFRSLNSKEIFSKSELSLTFLLIGFTLSLFFITFFSFPNLSTFLPPINILTLEYGHSHFAALLLFLIPLGWWFSVSKEYSLFRFRKSILVLFYIVLIFTFGRFAIILSIVQLPFLLKLSSKKKFKKKYIYLISSIIFLLLLAIFSLSFNLNKQCLTQDLNFPICKPITNDSRPEYFKQALLAFIDRPLVGYGPGTFTLITRRYSDAPKFNSIYAHNSFLHIFAEAGLFAGLSYFFLMFFMYKNILLRVKKNKQNFSVDSYIFVGIVSLLINSLMDFDWNLFAIFQMSVILIAILTWNDQKDRAMFLSKQANIFFQKFFLLLISIFLIVLGIVNILTQLFILNGKFETSFKTFPYFYFQSDNYLKGNNISIEQRQFLYKIYENHIEFIYDNIDKTDDIKIKKELYQKFIEVNPLQIINTNYYKVLKEIGDYGELAKATQKGLFLLDYLETRGITQSYKKRGDIMSYLHESAINSISAGNLEMAINYYRKILPVFYDIKNYSEYDLRYAVFFDKDSTWSSNIRDYLQLLFENDPNLTREELLKIEKMSDSSKSYGFNEEPFIGVDLADLAVSIAEVDLVNKNSTDAAKMYVFAQKMDEQVFYRISPKFLSLLNSDEQKKEFWSEMDIIPDEYYRNYSDQIAREYLLLFREAIEKKDADLVTKRFEKVTKIAPWVINELSLNELTTMQNLANYFIDKGDWDSAHKIVELIYKTNTYYGKMQLGNYYLLKGEKELSLKAYSSCNQEWIEDKGNEHNDCQIILNSYDKANTNTYWQVSYQILGD